MEILSQREHVDEVSYEHFFQMAKEKGLCGYGFSCTKDGALLLNKMAEPAQKNCEDLFRALNGDPDARKKWTGYRYMGIQEKHHTYIRGLRIRCDCDRVLELNGDSQCECGRWYNAAGDQLVSRDQWEEPWEDD